MQSSKWHRSRSALLISTASALAQAGRRLLLVAIFIFLIPAMTVCAEPGAKRFDFHIQAQPLSSALKIVAETTDTQVVFSTRVVADIKVPTISGSYTLQEVLQLILEQHALDYAFNGTDIIAIKSVTTGRAERDAGPGSTKDEKNKDPFVIEEVQVTVRKRVENLQDIPMSVASFSAAELAMQQITRMDRLGQFTPNLQFSALAASSGHNASSTVFIRGIGQTDFIPSSDPGVGIYVDGIYYARSVGSTLDIIDIERIDVLRGPQGTLFGKNTIGGALLVHSHRPENEFGGRIKAELASDNGRELLVTLNIPFSADFHSRYSIAAKQRDGYVTRVSDGKDLGNDNVLSARAAFNWSLTDNLHVDLLADFTREDERGTPQVFNSINTQALFPIWASMNAGCPGANLLTGVPENNDPRCANNQYQALGPYRVDSNGPLASELEAFGGIVDMEWQLKTVQVRSVTGYRKTDWFSARDADNTPLTILHTFNDETQEQFSQEIQLGNHFRQKPLQWILGAYYFRESAFEDYPVFLPEPQVGVNNTRVDIDNESRALFGQISYDFNEHFTLTAGLRYTWERKEVRPFNGADLDGPGYNVPNPRSPNPSCAAGAGPEDCIRLAPGELLFDSVRNKKTINETSPMINFSYRWSDRLMAYLSYSEGFKSGGFGTRISAPVVSKNAPTGRELLPDHDPEFAQTYEVGFKSALLNERLELNLALFYSNYDDIQVVSRESFIPVLFNAGTADIYGMELEWRHLPVPTLLINGGLGLIRVDYREFTPELLALGANSHALGSVDLDDRFAHTPEVSANLGIAYAIATDVGRWVPRLDFIYQSEIFFDAANTRQISQPGYTIVNASLMFESLHKDWKVVLSGHNLNNKRYRIAGNSSLHTSSGYAESAYARPREWSLAVEYRF